MEWRHDSCQAELNKQYHISHLFYYLYEPNILIIKMFSSQNKNIIFTLYNNSASVFTLPTIALLLGETNFQSLNQKLNYYVRTGKLLRPRKGIYAKHNYNPEELACLLYTPSYLSLEYVLQKAGIVFQYDSRITAISYLSRNIETDNHAIAYRKIKNDILINIGGITQIGNVNIATPERAFLDILYLNATYYFDNLHALNKNAVYELLPIYNSKTLTQRVNKIFANDGCK